MKTQATRSRKSDAGHEGLAESPRESADATPWYRSTVGLAAAGGVLLWLSHPPADLGFLGWVAPLFWLLLIRQPQLTGKRPYLVLYGVGAVYWATTTYWLTLPHWSTSFGWVAMSVYLACYVVLFIGLSRVAIHQIGIPLVVAAPVVWTGLELIRAHFATGFLLAALAHTQYRWIGLIQISDLVGAYGVSLLVMFVVSCVATALPTRTHGVRWWPVVAAVTAVAAVLAYGHFQTSKGPSVEGPKIALIQGNIPTVFGGDPEEKMNNIYRQYITESRNALQREPDIELLVWPESMYVAPLVLIDDDAYLPAEILAQSPGISLEDAQEYEAERRLPDGVRTFRDRSMATFRQTLIDLIATGPPAPTDRITVSPPAMLLGVEGLHYRAGDVDYFNTSLYLSPQGEVVNYYHKMHTVMFGEYVPLGDYFPFLYSLTPLGGGLTAGDAPKTYQVGDATLTPNICFETILPHVIRGQISTLRQNGNEPDVIVTQTNDGWFWGSAALDMHLICGVFRAVECRKPLLIAANTGISAHIDADGRILQQARRQEIQSLIVRPQIDARRSLYVDVGDWLAWLCAVCCLA
ncbi:MAG TPA: apolipoprotein N-acyltransferase, partial [Pirellulales bacterium]|nr:apolipoprotein N-acyltransferase [Pirellulales bacterium]